MSKRAHSRGITGLLKRINIEHIWALAAIIGILAFLNTHPIRPHDFWWHIAAGREIVTTGKIPAVDSASFTAVGTPYPAYKTYWLAETGMYLIYTAGGPALAVFSHSLTVLTAYGLTLWLCYRRSGNWRAAALGTLFAAALGLNDWNVRPQAAVFWLLPLFLMIIDIHNQERRRLLFAALPVGMIIWVNCHGSFPIGLATIGLWLVDRVWRTLSKDTSDSRDDQKKEILTALLGLGTASLACLLNPRGAGIIEYIKTLTTNPIVQNLVPEWMPPSFGDLGGTLFLIGLMFTAAVLAISPRRPTAFQLLTFLMFGLLGLKTTRGIIWFGLAMAPSLAEHLTYVARELGLEETTYRAQTKLTRSINTVFAGLLILSGLITLPWFKNALPLPAKKAGLISQETPIEATEYLISANLPGQVFHAMSFGSYLIWAAQPAYPVFVDPRIELYSPAIWYDYIEISAATGNWEDRLNKYGVRTLMLSREEQPALVAAAEASERWQTVYDDETAVILTAMVPE